MISAEYVRSRLHYDPATGIFTWKPRPVTSWHMRSWNTRFAGARAGHVNCDGYKEICIDYKAYKAHTLAWLYVHGEYEAALDHIDRDRLNNKIRNLRRSDEFQNSWNRSISSRNTSGKAGVRKCGNRWHANIFVRGTRLHLGSFGAKDDAIAARLAAEVKHFGEFSPHPVEALDD